MSSGKILIGIVGVCASGKTSLIRNLSGESFEIRHIAQEHSYVKDMWKRITNPDLLVYLEVSYENTISRKHLGWTRSEYEEELKRLQHARENADLIVDTNSLTESQVAQQVLDFINTHI